MTITFPRSVDEAVAASAVAGTEYRAGGTDWQERRELGLTQPHIVDLRDLAELATIAPLPDGGFRIGARVHLRELVEHPAIAHGYPALVKAAGALATPQIRAVATVGGSLLQRSRCWYYRSARFRCFKSGGEGCPARDGDHHFHACFDLGPCIAPHPSTVGMALLTYGASVEVSGATGARSVAALFGDGTDPTRDHTLGTGELLTAVRLPPPEPNERGGYFRAISRAWAEWPLVEVAVRLVLVEQRITLARVAIGGVANIPLSLPAVDALLEGSIGDEAFERAGQAAAQRAQPLPGNGYKIDMISGAVVETLTRAIGGAG
jgi:xanthine dehydrogenase YagS FAD-binding subunit